MDTFSEEWFSVSIISRLGLKSNWCWAGAKGPPLWSGGTDQPLLMLPPSLQLYFLVLKPAFLWDSDLSWGFQLLRKVEKTCLLSRPSPLLCVIVHIGGESLPYYFCLFLAAPGLHCFVQTFPGCSEQQLLFIPVRRFLLARASLVVEHRF